MAETKSKPPKVQEIKLLNNKVLLVDKKKILLKHVSVYGKDFDIQQIENAVGQVEQVIIPVFMLRVDGITLMWSDDADNQIAINELETILDKYFVNYHNK